MIRLLYCFTNTIIIGTFTFALHQHNISTRTRTQNMTTSAAGQHIMFFAVVYIHEMAVFKPQVQPILDIIHFQPT